ncbi:hypothetical protein [Serratia fonticola]
MKIIDALVVTLGLDNSGFKKGAKETREGMDKVKDDAAATAKVMQEQGKKAGEFFGNIRTELIALVGIGLSINSFKNLIVNTANSFAALGRASAPLNMSARELDAWQHSAMAFGGTAEGLTSSMQSLSDSIYAFSMGKGGEQAIATLRSLGISAKDASGKAKSMGQIYLEVSEEFKKRNLSAGQARQFGMALGMDAGTINMLLEGPEKVKKVFGEMYQNSGVTDDAVRRSQQFQVTWAKIDQTFQAVRERLFTALIPYIEKLLVLLDRFAKWVSTHQAEINGFFTSTADVINTIVDAVGGVENALSLLLAYVAGKWLLGMLGAIGKVAGGLGGIGKALPIVAAAAASVAAEPYIDKGLNALFGKNDYFQNIRTAPTWKEFFKAVAGGGEGRHDEQGNWIAGGEPEQHAQSARRQDPGFSTGETRSGPRGIRNNNPGNLNFAGQAGAQKEGGPNGRFAVFQSMTAGVAALYRQIQLYASRGINTISKIVNKYAPAADNNNVGAYIKALMGATGKDANEALDTSDMQTMMSLLRGIINHENGKGHVSDDQILKGMQVGAGVSAQQYGNTYNRGDNSTTTTDTQIGQVNVYTQATDANGIARDMGGALRRNTLIGAANGGVS